MVKTIIDGHKRFGLPEDWKKSMTLDELLEHFNLLAKDAKKIHDLFVKLVMGGRINEVRDLADHVFSKLEEEE